MIGEITGARKPDEVVLIGGHLDSWDLGTGAIDDGAGVALTMAAGKLIGDMKQRTGAHDPRGRVRQRRARPAWRPCLCRGACLPRSASTRLRPKATSAPGRIYAFDTSAPEHAQAAVQQIAQVLAPLGIEQGPGEGGPGPDISPFAGQGLAWASLSQDGTDYFDLHHTPDDTLDKIDPKALAQNVAAYAVFAYLAAEAEGDFGSGMKPAAAAP